MEDRETGVLTKPRCGTKERDPKLQDHSADISAVMSKCYASCNILRMEKVKVPERWKKFFVGGIERISCQHLQVMMTNFLQRKHWEWQEDRSPMSRHGSAVRSTL